MLADLGADVAKVELPTGDRLRRSPPFRDGEEGQSRACCLPTTTTTNAGSPLIGSVRKHAPSSRKLAATADAVIASAKRRAQHQRPHGFVDVPPSLSWVPDGAATCFITPFGLTGPYRDWRATPFTSFAMSGLMHPVGPPRGSSARHSGTAAL